ncbi:MAG TPA: FAD-dependent oxidoreductase [Bdellovibrionota bacterium]|jgi:glycine/D-amino acid oxidase-like deaminating enzyme/nitrite reductase/ring-hydroxylating ferredoxin subunit
MAIAYQETHSVWQEADQPFLPSLGSHETADVCVIGAGISGLTTAYELLESGRSVVVLERSELHSGQTILSSAHLVNALDDRYFTIRKKHGLEKARLAAESHTRAIDEVERIIRAEGIDCEFARVPGFLFLYEGDEVGLLHRELDACHAVGLKEVELTSPSSAFPVPLGPSLRFPHQARFHPGKYLAGLARAIQRKGGKIYTRTEAQTVEGGHPARVTTNRGFQVVSESIVVATNVPFNDRFTMHTKMAPYRTYIVGLAVPEHDFTPALFWDTGDPYHYIRSCIGANDEQILLVGGEDHRTGQDQAPENRFRLLRTWARDRLGVEGELRYQWSGQILEPHDGMAFIGLNPGDKDNVYIVTGDSGNGLTHGTIAGMLLRDLISKKDNPWSALYDPARVSLRSFTTLVSETAQSTAPYADWVTGGDVSTIAEIPAGEGAVVREGMQKLAVYRDHNGLPHFFSAVCPHLNGIVRWNSAEKTWDCPCHGSRFDRLGHLVNGPATTGLSAVVDSRIREEGAASA